MKEWAQKKIELLPFICSKRETVDMLVTGIQDIGAVFKSRFAGLYVNPAVREV